MDLKIEIAKEVTQIASLKCVCASPAATIIAIQIYTPPHWFEIDFYNARFLWENALGSAFNKTLKSISHRLWSDFSEKLPLSGAL